jgi:hypothetical protein
VFVSERRGYPRFLNKTTRLTGGVLEIEFPRMVDKFVAEINGFLERKKGTCEDPQY